jgi:hypothetical protein
MSLLTREDFISEDGYVLSNIIPNEYTGKFYKTHFKTLQVGYFIRHYYINTEDTFEIKEVNYNHYVLENINTKDIVKIKYVNDTESCIKECPRRLTIKDLEQLFIGNKRLDYLYAFNAILTIEKTKENVLQLLHWLYKYLYQFEYKFSSNNTDQNNDSLERFKSIRAAMLFVVENYITETNK